MIYVRLRLRENVERSASLCFFGEGGCKTVLIFQHIHACSAFYTATSVVYIIASIAIRPRWTLGSRCPVVAFARSRRTTPALHILERQRRPSHCCVPPADQAEDSRL